MKTTRRLFVKRGGIALASVGIAPAFGPLFLTNTVFAQEPQRANSATGGKKILICIFQRGAVDGLSMVAPHGDPHYYQLRNAGRGGIALAQTGDGSLIDLDGFYGLHPSLAPLKPIYDAGHLAPIHACGSPNATRSHFDAQDFMESGAPGDKAVYDGWLARTIRCCPEDNAKTKSLFRGVAMTSRVPASFRGDSQALAIPDLRTFGIKNPVKPADERAAMEQARAIGADDDTPRTTLMDAFQSMYDGDAGDLVHGAGQETFEALKIIRKIKSAAYTPTTGANYPKGQLGESLQQIAQLIKADVGVEIAFAETGGWDTHANQGGAQGRLATNLRDLGQSLAALYTDLGDRMSDVVILTMSEFGRTARQNGNGGTDHGHGTCFMALGGNIQGGKVLGQWPGLAPEQLYEQRDLAITTDFRSVFGEIAGRHMGVKDLATVFPAFDSSPASFRGLLKA